MENTNQDNNNAVEDDEEDHEIIHARMVYIFKTMMIVFAVALLVITAIFVYLAKINLYISICLFVFALVFPAFVYKISVSAIRNYPLD